MKVLGIDVGGSSIKGGLVDVAAGRLIGEIAYVPTPKPSRPEAVMKQVAVLGAALPGAQAVGFAFPSVVKNNIARTAANVDHGWIGADGVQLARSTLGLPAVFLNDADAAGVAEMRWGAGRNTPGTVIMLTFGTGIGTAMFSDGKLLPNTEFGHIQMRGMDAEEWASARVRTEQNLDFPQWIERVNEYLALIHALFWPDVFILGGAVSERFDQFAPLLKSEAEIRPAQFGNTAGVMGAALAAAEAMQAGERGVTGALASGVVDLDAAGGASKQASTSPAASSSGGRVGTSAGGASKGAATPTETPPGGSDYGNVPRFDP